MHREADDEPNDIKYRESIQDIGAAAMLSALLTSKTSKFVNVNVNVVPLLTASRVQDTGDALKQQLPLQYYCYFTVVLPSISWLAQEMVRFGVIWW